MSHTIQSLKLDLGKLTDIDQKLTVENTELIKRLAMFEEENRNLSNLTRQLDEVKVKAELRSEEMARKLKEAVAKTEEIALEKAELSFKVKKYENEIESFKVSQKKATEEASIGEDEVIKEYKEESNRLKIEIEKYKDLQLKQTSQIVKLESDLKAVKTEAEDAKISQVSSTEELAILKARNSQLEAQRKKYFNDLGTANLGLSSLNFSKYFGDGQLDAVQEEGSPTTKQELKQPAQVQQIPTNLGSFGLDLGNKHHESRTFGEQKTPVKPPQIQVSPPVDFLGRHQTPEFHFDIGDGGNNDHNPYMDRASAVNPYMDRMSSMRPKQFGSILRVRESRVTTMLNVVGGIKDEFDDQQDFIGLSGVDKVGEEISRFGDTTLAPGRCYSDSVFLFDKNLVKNRAYVLVTQHSISFFNLKRNKLIKLYLLKSLKSVTISAENFTLSVFQFEKQPDLLLESYRRLELISYINQMFQQARLPKFGLIVRKRFIIKTEKNQRIPEKLEVANPNKEINLPFLQEAIRNSKKSGYLLKEKKGWFGSTSTTEYFCILSNIGIIYFKKYGVTAFNARIKLQQASSLSWGQPWTRCPFPGRS